MKKLTFMILMTASALPGQAQLFSPESLGGAAVGGIIGGVIGHNSGHKTAEGVAIGAGAGLVLGALTGYARRDHYESSYQYGAYVPVAPAPVYSSYGYYYSRPNYAVTGAILGGVAGGVIGHNSGHKTGEGIAIGAGAGLLLGAIAEQDTRRYEHSVPLASTYVVAQPQQVIVAPQPQAAQTPQPEPQPAVVVQNNHYRAPSPAPSPMAGANGLFGR